ncbi:unnamed protein product [Amoebophrya sp. A120]|nr:unnamed protein product [Amoebophrya sp. A120]|eukprot:GSA120T00023330001.1
MAMTTKQHSRNAALRQEVTLSAEEEKRAKELYFVFMLIAVRHVLDVCVYPSNVMNTSTGILLSPHCSNGFGIIRNEILTRFGVYDYDKSDSISPDEMRDLLTELGFNIADESITLVISQYAADPNKVTFAEFKGIYVEFLAQMPSALRKKNMAGACRPCHQDVYFTEASYRSAFKAYDFDASGTLERSELSALLFDLGMPDVYGDNYSTLMDEAFSVVDWDHSESLDFQEFCQFINEVIRYVEDLRESQTVQKVY